MKTQQGFSLIEMTLALMLSTIILNSLILIYITTVKSTRLQTSFNALQDNANLATHLLKNAIQMAGFIGCPKLTADFPLANDSTINPNTKLSVINETLMIQEASLAESPLIKPMRGFSTLYTTDALPLHVDDLLLISDCKTADIFWVKAIETSAGIQKILTRHPLSHLYGEDAVVRFFTVNRFFIADTERKDEEGQPIYALYVKTLKEQSELVEGISAWHLERHVHDHQPTGVSIAMTLCDHHLQKPWFAYVALQN